MPYFGINILDLNSADSTPVILIMGENGHGKTSIHHAIRWCLFGKTRPLKSEEIIPAFRLLNWKCRADFESIDQRNPQYREAKFSIQLNFSHLGQTYELKRVHTFVGADLKGTEEVSLRIDNGNYVSGGKIAEIVEGVLSEELSQFFLFDGEVLDRFEEMRTQELQAKFVKQQIESTLGIPKLKQALEWVNQKRDEQFKLLRKSESQSKKDLELRERITKDDELRKIKESERSELTSNLKKDREELDKLKLILGNYELIKRDLERERELRSDIKDEEKAYFENVNSLASLNKSHYWAPAAVKLLEIQKYQNELRPVVQNLEKERDSLATSITLHYELKKTGKCPVCGNCAADDQINLRSKVQDLEGQLKKVQEKLGKYETVYISDYEQSLSTLEFSEMNYVNIKTLHKKIARNKENVARKRLELNSVLERAPVNSLEADQKSNLASYENLTRRIAQDEITLNNIDKEIEVIQHQLSANHSQLARSQSNTTKPARMFSFYSNLATLMEKTIEGYAQDIRTKVEIEASKVFNQIISEKDFEELKINVSFGMEIKKKDGHLVNLRSEGQAHIAAISLVAGLLKTAVKDGFILMDTPFGRLDMTHRENICRWIVGSGLQIALFVHSGEFRMNEHIHLLAGRVGRTYSIKRIDSNRSEFQELN